VIIFRYRVIAFLKACLYVVDGKTNKINVSNVGINDIKYPERNNHELLVDFIQPDENDITIRGITSMTKIHGPIRRFLCC
jgi:hypothetical protein